MNTNSKLNRTDAIREDKHGEFYVDLDDETNDYGVFGSETGFCYGTFADERAANDYADQMNLDNCPKKD